MLSSPLVWRAGWLLTLDRNPLRVPRLRSFDKIAEILNIIELMIFTDDQTGLGSTALGKVSLYAITEEALLDLSDISFPKGCNGLTKYADAVTIYGKKTPMHVRGALIYNRLIDKYKLTKRYPTIQNGEKLKYIQLKEPNPIQSDIISFPPGGIPKELGLIEYIDYETQFQKSFVEPLKIILDSIGWKSEKRSSLDDFFC